MILLPALLDLLILYVPHNVSEQDVLTAGGEEKEATDFDVRSNLHCN